MWLQPFYQIFNKIRKIETRYTKREVCNLTNFLLKKIPQNIKMFAIFGFLQLDEFFYEIRKSETRNRDLCNFTTFLLKQNPPNWSSSTLDFCNFTICFSVTRNWIVNFCNFTSFLLLKQNPQKWISLIGFFLKLMIQF